MSSSIGSDQLQAREGLAIAAGITREQGNALHQGMGSDHEIRQHGLAGAAPCPEGGVGLGGEEGGLPGNGAVGVEMAGSSSSTASIVSVAKAISA